MSVPTQRNQGVAVPETGDVAVTEPAPVTVTAEVRDLPPLSWWQQPAPRSWLVSLVLVACTLTVLAAVPAEWLWDAYYWLWTP